MVQSLPQPSTLASQAKRQLSFHVNHLPLGLGASLTNSRMKSRKSTRPVPFGQAFRKFGSAIEMRANIDGPGQLSRVARIRPLVGRPLKDGGREGIRTPGLLGERWKINS